MTKLKKDCQQKRDNNCTAYHNNTFTFFRDTVLLFKVVTQFQSRCNREKKHRKGIDQDHNKIVLCHRFSFQSSSVDSISRSGVLFLEICQIYLILFIISLNDLIVLTHIKKKGKR